MNPQHRPPEVLTEQLISFASHLQRSAGYRIGVTQFFRIQELVFTLALQDKLPAELHQFELLLAPILCHSPAEQQAFKAHFEQWVCQVEGYELEKEPKSAENLESETQSYSQKIKSWKWIFVVFAVVFVSSFAFYFTFSKPPTEYPSVGSSSEKLLGDKKIEDWGPSKGLPTTTVSPGPKPTHPPIEPTPQPWLWLTLLIPLALALVSWLSWHLWWQYQVQRFLIRKSTSGDINQCFIQDPNTDQFMQLSRVAQQLHRHIDIEVNQLDIATTLEKTVRAAGWFTPATAVVKQLPEYLVLIDRITFSDHQARWVDTLINQLVEERVIVNRYYFDTDPRHCHPEQNQWKAVTLKELAEYYDHCRLLIFSDGSGLIELFTGQIVPWINQFSAWSQRVLFTLITPNQWGYKEQLLENADFLILPANEKGLQALAKQLETHYWQPYVDADDTAQPLPKLVHRFSYRWLEREPPESDELSDLLKQLQNFLGQEGYYWFSACAVYPELRWPLTLYLGDKLKLLTTERLTQLARLPWFRYGYMPNWLRKQLILGLLKEGKKKVIHELVKKVLKKPDKSESGFLLNIASKLKNHSNKVTSSEHVSLSFWGNILSVKVPQAFLRHILEPTPVLRTFLVTFMLFLFLVVLISPINLPELIPTTDAPQKSENNEDKEENLPAIDLTKIPQRIGSCTDFKFPLDNKGNIDTTTPVRALRQSVPVYQYPASTNPVEQLKFGEAVFPLKMSQPRRRIQVAKYSSPITPLGWVNAWDLLCADTPLTNEKNLSRKAFIKTPIFETSDYVYAFPAPNNRECEPNCKLLSRFETYFIFAEDKESRRYLLAENYILSVPSLPPLIGWVDADEIIPWNTRLGLRPKENVNKIFGYPTLEDSKIGNKQAAIEINGGNIWYTFAYHMPLLDIRDEHYQVAYLLNNKTTILYIPIDKQKIQIEIVMIEKHIDALLKLLKPTAKLEPKLSANNQREELIKILRLEVQSILGDPPLEEQGTLAEQLMKYKNGLPIYEKSPLLQYEIQEIRTMEFCELVRLIDWIRRVRNILAKVISYPAIKVSFKLEDYPNDSCPNLSEKGKRIKRMVFESPELLGPDDSYRYGHAFRGLTLYWLPIEFMP